MQKYFYEVKRPERNLEISQYIYWIGPYRYNWHEELEIMLILKGEVEVSCAGISYILKENDLMLIDSNVGHASLARTQGSIAMVIHLNPSYLREYYQPAGAYSFFGCTDQETRDSREAQEIRRLMAVMITRMDTRNPLEILEYDQDLSRMLLFLFRLFPPRRMDEKEAGKTEKHQDIISRIISYVEENYRSRITLKELGELCGYNSTYVSTYFKSHVGINFYDYLMRIRLREATLDLCSTDKTILEVASNNGFADVKSFNQNFRKTFGRSPGEYRRQILEENRGMDFKEKRRFLPLDDGFVNRRLEEWQLGAGEDGREAMKDSSAFQAYMSQEVLSQARQLCRQARNLQNGLDEIEKKLKVLWDEPEDSGEEPVL